MNPHSPPGPTVRGSSPGPVFPPAGPLALDTLDVLGQARDWAQHWAADVRTILQGQHRLGWHDVERGVLLKGGHGTGKTSFVRALARSAGLSLVECVLPPPDTEVDQLRTLLDARWEEARSRAPALLLVESTHGELEALGTLWDRFCAAQPVVVVVAQQSGAACPGLLRPGRIERVFEIVPPGLDALRSFLAPLLAAAGAVLEEPACTEFLRSAREHLSSLSELALVVRQATLDARREGGEAQLRHFLQALYATGETSVRELAPDAAEAIAYHEAGHAVLMLLGQRGRQELSYLSIVPSSEQLGVTRLCFDESRPSETCQELLERLQSDLGGRAAEEIRYGPAGISTGCSSDLEQATQLALQMCTRYGFGGRRSLLSWEGDLARHAALREEVEVLLAAQYEAALDALRRHWSFVEELAEALLVRKGLSGDEVRTLFDEWRSRRDLHDAGNRFRRAG